MSNPNIKDQASKGGKTTGPQKRGYFMERLAEEVFKSEEVFTEWVKDNYTDAIKELGKLQPKNDKLEIAGRMTVDIFKKRYDGSDD
jgi:hypothetical protein